MISIVLAIYAGGKIHKSDSESAQGRYRGILQLSSLFDYSDLYDAETNNEFTRREAVGVERQVGAVYACI